MKHWPNTATLFYTTPPTFNTLGYPVVGTTGTLAIYCHVKPNSSRMVVSADGTELKYQYDVSCPLISTSIVNTNTLQMQLFGKKFPVRQRFAYQKHEEFKVG